ncbi:MAG: sigma-70 family RNA polymerase sigma factor [Labilithrix sp.]|nr:sigma-70 family RNA polymerase sigma factor [Labilithrix sp.]
MTDLDGTRFRRLFDAHFDFVWGALRRLGVRQDDVEDRAHEVFLNVYRKLADYDETRPIRPWLFGFAYRVASHARRTEQRRREVIGVDSSVRDPSASPDEQAIDRQERSILLAALDELDIDRRAVIVMHDWDSVPIPEVARALGVPLNTAYSRLRTARTELRDAVKRLNRTRGTVR